MYAGEEGSELFEGIGTDRFILSWKIAGERVERALADRRAGAEEPFREAPVVNPKAAIADLPEAPRVRIEIPESIQDLKSGRPEVGGAWRETTRRAFQSLPRARLPGRGVLSRRRRRIVAFYGLERD